MRIIITDSYRQMGREAANMVAGQLYLKPDSVLGLATGSTPLPMYRRLIALHHSLGLDFSEVTTFNLDEYVGMAPDNPQSYHYFMNENFFRKVNIQPDHTHLPDGMVKDLEAEGHRYDALIQQNGGSVRPEAPASILQLHRDVTVILDRAAASHLPTHIEGTKIIHKNNGKNTTFSS